MAGSISKIIAIVEKTIKFTPQKKVCLVGKFGISTRVISLVKKST